jgi:hypothetical protein
MALGALLEGMAEAAWLAPVTLPELATTIPASSQPATLVYPEEARARELSTDYLAQVQAGREAVRSLGVVLTGDSELLDAERLVQAASSVHYRDRPEAGLALTAAVTSTAQSVFDSIALIPGPMFTLTGDAGTTIPVVLVNNGGASVEVAVSMDGGQAFRVDPPTRPVVLDPGETTTVEFSVSALTPGITAPMQVRVTDVDGQRQLATERVVVQARTTSVAALALTAGAGLFLAVWWARDIARRRRTHRDERSRVPEPVG